MISFGVNYDWGTHQLQKAEDIPLLFNLREKARLSPACSRTSCNRCW
jgi:hypothetical protein